MSQEIMKRAGYALAEHDPWAGGNSGSAAQPSGSPLKKVHRLLRGRYLLAVVLAGLGALAGAVGGYLSQKPQFRSDGLIEISPIIDSPLMNERVMLMYNQYLQNQVALIQSQNVIIGALNSDDWKRTGRGNGPGVQAAFASQLLVTYVKDTSYIRVGYIDPDKEISQIAVSAVVRAYEVLYSDKQAVENRQNVNSLDQKKTNALNQINRKRQEILELSAAYGTDDVSIFHNAKLEAMVVQETMLEQAKFMMRSMSGAIDGTDGPAAPPTNEEIASVDKALAGMLSQRQAQELEIERLLTTYGANHRSVAAAKANLDLLDRQINKSGDDFRARGLRIVLRADGQGMELVSPETVRALKVRVDYLQAQYDKLKEETQEIGRKRFAIQSAQNEIAKSREDFDATSKRLEQMIYESGGRGRLTVHSYGNPPLTPSVDKRKQFAALGFLGGGLLPVGLLVVIGLLDARYRYSDDTSEDLSGIPLLGILPNLPDLMTDPDQAAVAAHCVHQIRTMLQINAGSAESKVFVTTSPSSGDGKTSLTMALGLSFAACGSRTLLIDCDMVGAGLTSRMNVTNPEGVLEALGARSLLPYVQSTDVANLAILPVGSAEAHHSSMLSPQAIRKLLAEARTHFDVVLVDTGPILGSIEAAPVASAADGVILVVARGQQRPLVEKSMRHLIAVGARLAGVVFNRANPRDFEKSVSRLSMRSNRDSSNGHGLHEEQGTRPRLGPVAKAVAKSVKRNG